MPEVSEHKKGVFYAIICYLAWGFYPLYWKLLQHVPAVEILCHRLFWSMVFMVLFFSVIKRCRIRQHVKTLRQWGTLLLTGLLMTANWGVYIWAINSGNIIQSSLGHYINPLFSILFGCIFLHEKMNKIQWTALILATTGVVYLTAGYGEFPWISAVIALTFTLYAYFRKKAGIDATPALTVETLFMSVPALAYLATTFVQGNNTLCHFDLTTAVLLALSGAVTAVPMLWFGMATQRIQLSTLGFIQYLSPTFQLVIGTFVFNENFTKAHLVCFIFIWSGLLLYTISQMKSKKMSKE